MIAGPLFLQTRSRATLVNITQNSNFYLVNITQNSNFDVVNITNDCEYFCLMLICLAVTEKGTMLESLTAYSEVRLTKVLIYAIALCVRRLRPEVDAKS